MQVGWRSFTTLFLTLVLVLAVPMVILVVVFGATVRTMVREDYIALNTQVIDNIRTTVDTYMTSRMDLAYSLSANQSLKILVAGVDETGEEMNAACRELYNYNRAVQSIGSMFQVTAIYIPSRDLVVSSTNIRMSGEEFYDRYVSLRGVDAGSFLRMVRSVEGSRHFPSARSEAAYGAARDVMPYVQPIDFGYLSYRAYFISLIGTEAFARLMTVGFEGGAHFRLLDGQGTGLTCSAGIPWAWDDSKGARPAHWSLKDRTATYHAFYSRSPKTDLQYVFFVPETTVLKRLTSFERVWLAVLVACLAVGLLIARDIAGRLHRPLQGLLQQAFPGGIRAGARSVQEEYGLLADKMRETQMRDRKFRHEIDACQEALRTYALLKLLTQSGSLTGEELREAAATCGLPLEGMAYQAAVIGWEGPDGKAAGLCAQLSEMHPGVTAMTARLAPGRMVAVIAVHGRQDVTAAALPGLIAWNGAAGLRIGISRPYDDPRRLQRCLSEASAACIRHADSPDAPYLCYGDLISSARAIHYPLEKEVQIISGVRAGDSAGVRRLLDEIREYNLVERRLVPEMTLCLYNSMIATACKAFDSIKSEHSDVLEHSVNALSMLHAEKQVTDRSFEEIQLLYRELCSLSLEAMRHKNRRIIDKVLDYMNENHANPALCLDMVADHFSVSYFYLSHMFKEETGRSFSDMLNGIRIDRAIGLLRASGATVQRVSGQVGYTNWSTFLRAFRKRTGTTPLQYRKEPEVRTRPADRDVRFHPEGQDGTISIHAAFMSGSQVDRRRP